MNFYERLKGKITCERSSVGRRGEVLVSLQDLNELIEHYEALESRHKVNNQNPQHTGIHKFFADYIKSRYYDEGCTDFILQDLLTVLNKLVTENSKRKDILKRHSK